VCPSQVFDKPGLATLRCDIHEHMRGLILVLATPHFAKTDGEGRFRLGGLPAGRYKLKAWLDSKTTLERPVTLPASGTGAGGLSVKRGGEFGIAGFRARLLAGMTLVVVALTLCGLYLVGRSVTADTEHDLQRAFDAELALLRTRASCRAH
jgi:hypothetical protein